jgi:preprotein translocase SecE subunit
MQKTLIFFKEAWIELRQVAWLPVPQMVASTWLVVILVIITSAFLFCVDYLLKHILGLFF